MKKLSIFIIAIIALSISISITYAQAGPDSDNDGVDDSVDSCISDPGPASNNGCPVATDVSPSTDSNNSDDRDGDGTIDSLDNCPDSGGPASNAGCPVDDTTTQPEPTAEPDTTIPTNTLRPDPNGTCQLTTVLSSRVNIRLEPSDSAEIVGQLSPDTLSDVLGMVIIDNVVWYRVLDGWVFEGVVVVGGNCPINITEASTSLDTTDIPDGSTNGLIPETQCTVLPHGELFCHTVLTAVPNDGATNGLVPSEKCVSLPSGENFCYDIILGIAPQAGADTGLVPQTECTTLLGSVPICFNIFVGEDTSIQPQTREHILLANHTPSTAISHQCIMLATGEEFCYNTFSTILPDDATNGLQPQTKCVDTLDGTPACFTILVASPADDGSTSGLIPQTQCTDLLGELICIDTYVAVANDGATDGLAPQTQCVDLLGETICIQDLVAYIPDGGSTSGLIPQTQCTDLLGETICIDTFTAVPNDGATDGLIPQTQCTDLLGETICIDTFTAVVPDNDFYQWGLLSLETLSDDGTPTMFNFINQFDINPDDDGTTEKLIPSLECVDTPGGTPFCYPTLIAIAPSADNTSGGLSPESSCVQLQDGIISCSLELVAYAEDPSGNMGLVPHTTCIGFFDETICFDVLSAVPEDGEDGLQGIIFGGDGRTRFSIPLPDANAAIAIPVFVTMYAPTQQTSQSTCIMFDNANLAYCPE